MAPSLALFETREPLQPHEVLKVCLFVPGAQWSPDLHRLFFCPMHPAGSLGHLLMDDGPDGQPGDQ